MKYEKIREYLLNNEKTLLRVVGDLNSYNGCLETLDFWLNDGDFFSCCFENPIDAVRTTYYGDYNYNDDYVKINAYGNIDSYTEEEKNEEIKDNIDDIVYCLIEYYEYIIIFDKNLENLLLEEDKEE